MTQNRCEHNCFFLFCYDLSPHINIVILIVDLPKSKKRNLENKSILLLKKFVWSSLFTRRIICEWDASIKHYVLHTWIHRLIENQSHICHLHRVTIGWMAHWMNGDPPRYIYQLPSVSLHKPRQKKRFPNSVLSLDHKFESLKLKSQLNWFRYFWDIREWGLASVIFYVGWLQRWQNVLKNL